MTENNNCPKCESPLPADAPGGACPRCLLAAGFESADGEAVAATPDVTRVAGQFPELEILSELGRGGMGVVYKARQKNLDRMVALKVLPREIVEGDEGAVRFEERFTREARALARLSHPNIVGVHEFGEREGVYYFLMEYVDGANLRQAMKTGDLTPIQALAIVPQICDALQYAHEQGVVHRDIKPENVLVDLAGRVKIADFGLAKLVSRTADERTLTRQGLVMGTPHYMAPEQIEKPGEVDHRADIYSLGVVLYEMLTGELPIGRFAPPSERVHIDVRLDQVVLRALEKDADLRYQAIVDVKTGIDAAGSGPVQHSDHRGGYAKRHGPTADSRRSRLALWGLVLPIVAVAVTIALSIGATLLEPADGGGESWRVMLSVSSVAGVVVLVGWVLSIVALVKIQRSNGALHGTGLAVAGLVLPLLCCVPAGLAPLFLFAAREEAADPGYGAPAPIEEVRNAVPAPIPKTRTVNAATRLAHGGDVSIELSVPAGVRENGPVHLDVMGRSADGAGSANGVVTVRSMSDWNLRSDHVLVVKRVTMTGDIGALAPTVHVGDVVIHGPDASGTDPTWQGAVAIAAGDEASVYAEVPGAGKATIVIEGVVLRPLPAPATQTSRSTHFAGDKVVTLRVGADAPRRDLAGHIDGGASGPDANHLAVPVGQRFVIESVVLRERPQRGTARVYLGADRRDVRYSDPVGKTLWTGHLEVAPGTAMGVWVQSLEGSSAAFDFVGRMYRVQEDE